VPGRTIWSANAGPCSIAAWGVLWTIEDRANELDPSTGDNGGAKVGNIPETRKLS
jgi:hypothetical protein